MRRVLLIIVSATTVFACDATYPIWIPRSPSADPLYRFIQDGKAGYINSDGKIVVPPTQHVGSNGGSEFHDGLLEVSVENGKYIDATGKLVLDPGLYRGWDFSEGLAVAMRKGEDRFGYIDTTGKFAIEPRFSTVHDSYVYPFSEGLAMVEVKGRFGFIDKSGEFAIPPQFLDASSFSDGLARVVVEGPCVYLPEGGCGFVNPRYPGVPAVDEQKKASGLAPCRFTYIDKSGRIITKQRFDGGRDFSEGLAPVQVGKLWGFIDARGNEVIPLKFEDAEPFSSGLTLIRANDKYGYADKSGEVVIQPQFEEAESFSDGLAAVGDGREEWYIDSQGKQSFPGRFEVASPFFKGLAHVELRSKDGDTFAYIDTKGREVFRYTR